jgi:HEAT repeat protein
MSRASHWDLTPRRSIERECAVRGRDAVVDGCIAILEDNASEVDDTLIVALGGPAAHRILSGESRADPHVWKRVWAVRGLLWAWDDRACVSLGSALTDRSWRVREMAVKVARRHLVGEQLATIATLQDDPVARVRTVAVDAVQHIAAARA